MNQRFKNRLVYHGLSVYAEMLNQLSFDGESTLENSTISKSAMALVDLPLQWTPEEYIIRNKLGKLGEEYIDDIKNIYRTIRSSGALFLPKLPVLKLIQEGTLVICDTSGKPLNIIKFPSGPDNMPMFSGNHVFATKRLPHGIHENWKYSKIYKLMEMPGNEADVACKLHKYVFLKDVADLSEPLYPPKKIHKKK